MASMLTSEDLELGAALAPSATRLRSELVRNSSRMQNHIIFDILIFRLEERIQIDGLQEMLQLEQKFIAGGENLIW